MSPRISPRRIASLARCYPESPRIARCHLECLKEGLQGLQCIPLLWRPGDPSILVYYCLRGPQGLQWHWRLDTHEGSSPQIFGFRRYLCRMVVSMLDMAGYKCIHSSVFMQDLIQKVFTQDPPYSRTSYDIYRRLRIGHLDQSEGNTGPVYIVAGIMQNIIEDVSQIPPMPVWCCFSVADVGTPSNQHRVNDSCLLSGLLACDWKGLDPSTLYQ